MNSKIIYSFLIFIFLTLDCYSQSESLFTEINSPEYEKYKQIDTLLNKNTLLITTAKNIKGHNRINRLLLRRIEIYDSTYFLFDAGAYLESDSTVILPTIRFKVVSNQEIKNGVWLYAEFTQRNLSFLNQQKVG